MKYVLVGLVLVVVAGALSSCATSKLFRQHKQFYAEYIEGNSSIQYDTLSNNNGTLHYATAGSDHLPAIVFIHGTPGSWKDLSAFLVAPKLRDRFQVFVVDRPGWGKSTSNVGKAVVGFAHQVEQIALLLQHIREQNPDRSIVVAGHSLGASIAPRLAVDYPQLVDGLLLLSGSHDPELAKPRRYHRAGEWLLINPLIGESLRKANKEMLVLDKQLAEMNGRWREITVPVVVLQGEKDSLVEVDNTRFLQHVLNHNKRLLVTRLKDIGHFTHLKSQSLIVDSAIQLLKQ